jgi:mRNA interferase MazF
VRLTSEQTGLHVDSKAQTEQVRAVSVTRARTRLGGVRDSDMADVDSALRRHLAV